MLGEKNLTSKRKYHTILLPKECGIQLLANQKSINRPGWWKRNVALFQILVTSGRRRVADICPKVDCPPTPTGKG